MSNQILEDILKNTDIRTFNLAITNYNIQALYERKKNYLLATYFDGNVLSFSITLRKMFDSFQTTVQEQKAAVISRQMKSLASDIRLKKKYKQPHSGQVIEYNKMAIELNELNIGTIELVSIYKKLNKNQ